MKLSSVIFNTNLFFLFSFFFFFFSWGIGRVVFMVSLTGVGTLPCLQELSQVKSSHFLFNPHKYVYMIVKKNLLSHNMDSRYFLS